MVQFKNVVRNLHVFFSSESLSKKNDIFRMRVAIFILHISFGYAERIDSASDFNRARFGVGVLVAFHISNIMPAVRIVYTFFLL